MTLSRRRNLVCFYCGCRSAEKYDKAVRDWQCERCDAVNFLDEKGEPTDPPTSITAASDPSATRIALASSGPSTSSESPFCPTCLKNQHILTQTLANYLPPPGDPKFAAYEAAYPAYRKTLEERYPQVCEECMPRVQERLKAAGYIAKTDYLRRMIKRTKEKSRKRERWDWREIFVFAGGAGWSISLLGQIAWHALGAMPGEQTDGLGFDRDVNSLKQCLRPSEALGDAHGHCVAATAPVVGLALLLGILSIWWNNQMVKKLRGTPGRISGLNDYYKLQVVVMFTRAIAWYTLHDAPSFEFGKAALRGAHAFMLAFLFLTAIISLRMVKLDNRLQFKFGDVDKIQSDATHLDRSTPRQSSYKRSSTQKATREPTVPSFPINKLVSNPSSDLIFPPSKPLTPPPDEQDADAMDWTPSQKTLEAPRQQFPHVQDRFKDTQSFSSYERLPLSQSQSNQEFGGSFSQKPGGGSRAPTSVRSQQIASPDRSRGRQQEIELAPPRFFPTSSMSQDTGLEAMLMGTRLVGDDSDESRLAESSRKSGGSNSLKRLPRTIFSTGLLIAAILGWKSAYGVSTFIRPLRMSSVGVAGILNGLALIDAFQAPNGALKSFAILLHCLEMLTSIAIATGVERGIGSDKLLDVAAMALLGGMVVQELWSFTFPLSGHGLQMTYDQPAAVEKSNKSAVPANTLSSSDLAASLSQPSSRLQKSVPSANMIQRYPQPTPLQTYSPTNAFSSFSLGEDSAPPSPSSVYTTTTEQSAFSAFGGRDGGSMTRSGRGYQGSRSFDRAY